MLATAKRFVAACWQSWVLEGQQGITGHFKAPFSSSPAACIVLDFVQSIHFLAAVNKCEMTLRTRNLSTVNLQGLCTWVLCFSEKTTISELGTNTSK